MMTEKNLGGRPEIELTEEEIKEVKKLSAELTVEQVADSFGFSRTTFYRILDRQPEVLVQYKKGRSQKIRKYVQHLDKKIFNKDVQGDTTALIFALKAFGDWSEKQSIETKDITPSKQLPQINIHVNDKPEHRLKD